MSFGQGSAQSGVPSPSVSVASAGSHGRGQPGAAWTLEWLTLSPPPHYNFAVLPDVHGEEAYWTRKQTAIKQDALIEEPDVLSGDYSIKWLEDWMAEREG